MILYAGRDQLKAWRINELGDPWEKLMIEEIESPSPKAGQISISVEATDLNFADILQCQGRYQVKLTPPFSPGMNAAGTILEVGEDVELQVGQRVVGPTMGGYGGYAAQAVLLAGQCQVLPDTVSSMAASAIHVTYGTAWFALHQRGNLQPGETVLVLAGAGGVGSAAIQLAKAHGCWVTAAAGGVDKIALCKRLGADEVIDYNTEELYDRSMRLTSDRGYDVIYDPVGGDFFDVVRRLVAWEGRLLVIGFASNRIPQAPANHILMKNYSVVGVHMGAYRKQDPAPFERCYNELYEMLDKGQIEPWIDSVVDFDELPAALLSLANRETKGRLVFEP